MCSHVLESSPVQPSLPPRSPTQEKAFPHVTELLVSGLKDTRTARMSSDLTPGHQPQSQRNVAFKLPNHILIELEFGVGHLQAKHRGSVSGLGISTGLKPLPCLQGPEPLTLNPARPLLQ